MIEFAIATMIIVSLILIILILFLFLFTFKVTNTMKDDFHAFSANNKNMILEEIRRNNTLMINEINNRMETGIAVHNEAPEPDLFSTYAKLRDSLKGNTITCLNELGAYRVAIYLLHNGNISTHGIKFFKTSCICEIVARGCGIREKTTEHSGMHINLLDGTISELIDNGSYVVINDDGIENTNQRIFISNPKIKYTQLMSIFDNDNNLLGFVCAEMPNEYNLDQSNNEKKIISRYIDQLIPVLAYSDYKEVSIKGTRK